MARAEATRTATIATRAQRVKGTYDGVNKGLGVTGLALSARDRPLLDLDLLSPSPVGVAVAVVGTEARPFLAANRVSADVSQAQHIGGQLTAQPIP